MKNLTIILMLAFNMPSCTIIEGNGNSASGKTGGISNPTVEQLRDMDRETARQLSIQKNKR